MKNTQKKYQQAGIIADFIGAGGIKQIASNQVKDTLYRILNVPKTTQSLLPRVKIFYQNRPHFIRLNSSLPMQGKWQLTLEQGQSYTGKIKKNRIQLSRDLPLGYHQLQLNSGKKQYSCSIIICPERCYQPTALLQKQKLWGTFLQLYTLKSERNWGIGDFTDLKHFIQQFSAYQGDFIGLNPIHALYPANPEAASPYSPSSRKWLNIAYIDVHNVAEFERSQTAQQWFQQPEIQQQLVALRCDKWVNYGKVIPLKLQALTFAFEEFCQNPTALRQQAFQHFLNVGGESLQIQATFDALHAHLSSQFEQQWGWDYWASEYQDYHSSAVQQFKQQYAQQVLFYAWLQFIADEQLAQCNALCEAKAMHIGLYRDLAVGVTGNGAETWCDKQLFCLEAAVGAPPDPLAPQGQNWGLTPMNPHILQQQAYRPFVELLRANMRHCGALRIDHIMSLLRLWWIPKDTHSTNGAYVRYPVDDLIAILALESQRHQCLVIGEDLGIVPKEIGHKLQKAGILSYKVFYFEFDQQGNSRDLQQYPYQTMTTLSTHDLPTINGYWTGYDFELGQQFGVYPTPEILRLIQQDRQRVKEKMLQRLQQQQITIENGISAELNSKVTKQFVHQLQCYVSNVSSALFGFQPEDWLNEKEPVNIPGTSNEYKNWRRKLSCNIDEIFADMEVQNLLKNINQNRKKGL